MLEKAHIVYSNDAVSWSGALHWLWTEMEFCNIVLF